MATKLDEQMGLITEEEYAAFRGKTLQSIRNDRSLGRGPGFVKLGKVIKYKLTDVENFVEANTVKHGRAPTLATGSRRNRRG